jgi:hypothetical protein
LLALLVQKYKILTLQASECASIQRQVSALRAENAAQLAALEAVRCEAAAAQESGAQFTWLYWYKSSFSTENAAQ